MSLPKPWASPEVVHEILVAGHAAVPNEACGIIGPDNKVRLLPNSSDSPTNSFVIATQDLVDAIEACVEEADLDASALEREQFIIWHTHPGGLIGPSLGDMTEKHDGFQYIVIALPAGEASIY